VHYLKEDKSNGLFLTSFTSTSINANIARSFSKNNNKDVIIYHFRVMPGTSCIYIGKDEAEVLLNPYQLYYFIKKDDNHYYYIILPSDIIPPHNANEFSKFKQEMMVRTLVMEGGKVDHHMAILPEYRTTRNSKSNRKNRNTHKNNKQKKLSEWEHFRARMNLPIGTSSWGIPITDDVRKEIERYARDIDQRIKNNKH